ncbi:hypothetical protein Droror1_Dr00015513 [Drosera rotundifolia]
MAPAFSRAAWKCVWYMIQNDLIHVWGLDEQLGYCAQVTSSSLLNNYIWLSYCVHRTHVYNLCRAIEHIFLYTFIRLLIQKILEAIILELLPKGLVEAEKALLSGCSAGGLAACLHCDNFTAFLPSTTVVKCLSDVRFFLDISS